MSTYNFDYPQGTDYTITVTYNDVNGVPVDLTGYTAAGQAREAYDSLSPEFTFTCTILNQITNTGQLTVVIPNNAITTVLSNKLNLVYDVELTNLALKKTRILQGKITVLPEVTR